MRILTVLGLLALVMAQALPAAAADNMSMSRSTSMGGMMAKCAPSNPAVIVNTTKMTYMMDTKANRMAMKGMMDHDRFVCRSTAAHMGAKMSHMAMTPDKMTGHM
jgi:hypothetical protein